MTKTKEFSELTDVKERAEALLTVLNVPLDRGAITEILGINLIGSDMEKIKEMLAKHQLDPQTLDIEAESQSLHGWDKIKPAAEHKRDINEAIEKARTKETTLYWLPVKDRQKVLDENRVSKDSVNMFLVTRMINIGIEKGWISSSVESKI